MFWHRGYPVAAVMGADAAIQVKVDLIRGPFARKSTPCRICPTATEKWEWYSSKRLLNKFPWNALSFGIREVILASFGSVKIIKEMCQFFCEHPCTCNASLICSGRYNVRSTAVKGTKKQNFYSVLCCFRLKT